MFDLQTVGELKIFHKHDSMTERSRYYGGFSNGLIALSEVTHHFMY